MVLARVVVAECADGTGEASRVSGPGPDRFPPEPDVARCGAKGGQSQLDRAGLAALTLLGSAQIPRGTATCPIRMRACPVVQQGLGLVPQPFSVPVELEADRAVDRSAGALLRHP